MRAPKKTSESSTACLSMETTHFWGCEKRRPWWSSRSSIGQVSPLATSSRLSNISKFVWSQVLNSLLDDPTLRSQCLYGLQRVSARCGLLPKSYWISLSNPAAPTDASTVAGRVSSTCQRLTDGKLVAVKTIIPDCVKDISTFKRVRPLPLRNSYIYAFAFWGLIIIETANQWGYLEATTSPERGRFPWIRRRFFSFLPCIRLDVQREFI